jgi:hypothetical protein
MAGEVLLIAALALGPMVVQLMAISVYMERMGRALQRAGDRPPFTTIVELIDPGPQTRAVTRLLERRTRLDLDEIDALIDRRGGSLPLAMSRGAAYRLVGELRAAGALATTHERPAR